MRKKILFFVLSIFVFSSTFVAWQFAKNELADLEPSQGITSDENNIVARPF
ncbi:MAG TPA: hypothetical protein VFM60_04375 [Salinimicrobium sp.]|nr:hypothetical protein [Salinimicrobium sp.]